MRKLTLLIPALNEEASVAETVNSLYEVARQVLEDVEVIVVNDGSSDNTGPIVDSLAKKNPAIVAVHHDQPKGLGFIFREGIEKAKFDYLTFIPGDNAYNAESLKTFFAVVGSADMILGYRTNQIQARLFHRALISRIYTFVMKLLFRTSVLDFHGPVVYPVQNVRLLNLTSAVSQVEFIVKLMRQDLTYVQVPVRLNLDKGGRSHALRWKTFVSVANMVRHLIFDG